MAGAREPAEQPEQNQVPLRRADHEAAICPAGLTPVMLNRRAGAATFT